MTDGHSAAVAFMNNFFNRETNSQLRFRKLWAAHGDSVVCLVSDLTANKMTAPARTALEQCRLRGTVTVAEENSEPRQLSPGEHRLAKVRWLQHGQLAYILPTPMPLTVKFGEVTGNWHRINAGKSEAPITDRIFLPVAEHDTNPKSQTFAYLIAHADTAEKAATLSATPPFAILRNNPSCQAVRFSDGTLMAVFYQPDGGKLELEGKTILTVTKPCVILQSNGKTLVKPLAN